MRLKEYIEDGRKGQRGQANKRKITCFEHRHSGA